MNKIKKVFNGIHWPSFKEVNANTWFSLISAFVLGGLIFLWLSGIEYVIEWIISMF